MYIYIIQPCRYIDRQLDRPMDAQMQQMDSWIGRNIAWHCVVLCSASFDRFCTSSCLIILDTSIDSKCNKQQGIGNHENSGGRL